MLMRGKSILVFILIVTATFHVNCQVKLRFQPRLEQQSIKLNDTTATLQIETLRFYISKIKFYTDSTLVWQEHNSYHLIDAADTTSYSITTNAPSNLNYNRIEFTFGIDSLTHEAGVMGGDLDPTKGMYWSWQSGYINFKIEGKSPQSKDRDNAFQYHIGGYKNGYSTAQTVNLSIDAKNEILIHLDLDEFLEMAFSNEKSHIMSPGVQAKALSKIIASKFTTDVKD